MLSSAVPMQSWQSTSVAFLYSHAGRPICHRASRSRRVSGLVAVFGLVAAGLVNLSPHNPESVVLLKQFSYPQRASAAAIQGVAGRGECLAVLNVALCRLFGDHVSEREPVGG